MLTEQTLDKLYTMKLTGMVLFPRLSYSKEGGFFQNRLMGES